jgi:hypothetical protein
MLLSNLIDALDLQKFTSYNGIKMYFALRNSLCMLLFSVPIPSIPLFQQRPEENSGEIFDLCEFLTRKDQFGELGYTAV